MGTLALVALAAAPHLSTAGAAGVYTVSGCITSDGAPNGASGWKPASGGDALTANHCTSGGTLTAPLKGSKRGRGSPAAWTFAAPPHTKIVGLRAQRQTTGVT